VRDLLLRMIRVRVPAWTWPVALLFTPVLAALAAVSGTLTDDRVRLGVGLPLSAVAGTLLLNAWMFLLTEETAWRGFALPRMQVRLRPLVASALLGAIWSLWHLPLFFQEGSFQSRIPFAGFVVSTIATSIVIGWLFDHARGSVLIAALFHAVTDVTIAFTGVMTSGTVLFWVFVTLQMLTAAAVAPSMWARDRQGVPAPPASAR
jgi:membrane protease YdiL (CAAX protease family)